MNKTLCFLTLFLSLTVFAQNEEQNQKLFEKIAGTYLYNSEDSCKLYFSLDKEGNYLIKLNDKPLYSGRANILQEDDNLYIDFGDLSTLYEDNTITFQNYGNSMNDYEHFDQCGEKYISLEKIE